MYALHETQIQATLKAEEIIASSAKIEDHAACELAAAIRSDLNKVRIEVEKERKAAKQPFLDGGRAIDDMAKIALGPIGQAITLLDNRRKQYMATIDAHRTVAIAQQALAEYTAQQESVDAAIPAALPPKLDIPEPAPGKTRTVERLVIDDLTAIPREYFDLNEARVRQAIKEGTTVPGARIVRDVVPA
jgi:hypothetical protein